MFDKRVANASRLDSEGGAAEKPPRWQPLINVSGNLVERVPGGHNTTDLFDNLEVSKLITELQNTYDEREKLSSASSIEYMSSSSGSPRHQSSSRPRMSSDPDKEVDFDQSAHKQTQKMSKERKSWRRDRFASRLDSSLNCKAARSVYGSSKDTNQVVCNRGGSTFLTAVESERRKNSSYVELLDSVMAEIEENESLFNKLSGSKRYAMSPVAADKRGRPRTPSSKYAPNSTSKINQASPQTNHAQTTTRRGSASGSAVTKSPTHNAFCFSSPSQLSSSKASLSAKRAMKANNEENFKNLYLNKSFDTEMGEGREQKFVFNAESDVDCKEESSQPKYALDCCTDDDNAYGDVTCSDDLDEDIMSHPAVQALLSEEKGKRWALLKSLHERETSLEKQIQDLRKQLREQTNLANHFRRMQQELITSHSEKENLWEREINKLMEKLKSGHEKMMLCSKLILHLENDRKEKDEKIRDLLCHSPTADLNRNDVYKYHILTEDDSTPCDATTVPKTQNSKLSPYSLKCSVMHANLNANTSDVKSLNSHGGQSELGVISESEALINNDDDNEVPCLLKVTPPICMSVGRSTFEENTEGTASDSINHFWSSAGLSSEVSQMKKLVSSCKLNAEKQCRFLKQMLPAADNNSSKPPYKANTLTLPVFDDIHLDSFYNDSDDCSVDNDEDDEIGDNRKGTVCRSKSFSASLGLNLGHSLNQYSSLEQPPNSYLSSHFSSSVSAISTTTNNINFAATSSNNANMNNQPSSIASGDPFDLDLKVKYCSTENIAHVMQSCSLTSPLMTPCSSFDEGLATQQSKSSSVFGSSVIVSGTGTGTGIQCQHQTPSPTRISALIKQMSLNCNSENVVAANRNFPNDFLSYNNTSRMERQHSVFDDQVGHSNGNGHTVEHEAATGSNSTGQNDDSLMLFDTNTEEILNATNSVIKDFDPLE